MWQQAVPHAQVQVIDLKSLYSSSVSRYEFCSVMRPGPDFQSLIMPFMHNGTDAAFRKHLI